MPSWMLNALNASLGKRLLEQVSSDGAASGGGQAPQATPPASSDPGSQPQGRFDDYGYAIKEAPVTAPPPAPATPGQQATPPPAPAQGEAQPQQTPPPEQKAESFSGYGAEPVADPGATPEPAAKPDAQTKEDIGLGYDLNIEGVDREAADGVKAFAKAHSLTKEQAQAIMDIRRQETADLEAARTKYEADRKAAVHKQRKEWFDSLKSDAEFGGQNFDHNVQLAERTFAEHFPHTKKELTDRKAMMPPWLMRDMAALGKSLTATPSFTPGSPAPAVEKNTYDDPLSYYDKK